MCGIAGIVSVAPLPSPVVRQQMLDLQQHRGPDGEGQWVRASSPASPHVWFGHRRLAIIDRSNAAAQPMRSDDGSLCITYNGEIYNYLELMAQLQALGHRFHSKCDTEVLLRAYEEWGPACLERLNGMFAFAIWDERHQQLFAGRDRFGEKPFHYAWNPDAGWFAFASEIKALLALPGVDATRDERALYRFLAFRELAGLEQTLWRGVRRLPRAHQLHLSLDGERLTLSTRRYWDIDLERRSDVPLDVAAQELAALFADSIRLRLRADVPVGTSLSGGLDSSAVVCQIAAVGAAGGQKAFSARMTDPALDEGRHIAAVLRQTGVEGHEVWPSPEELPRIFARLCYHLEEPFLATSQFAQHLVMRLAAEQGVTVLLDGQGADELMAGYKRYFRLRYAALAQEKDLIRLWREQRAFRQHHGGPFPLDAKALGANVFPGAHRWLGRSGTAGATAEALWPDMIAWCDTEWLAAFSAERPRQLPASSRDLLTRTLYADALDGPLQELLRYGDRNSMAWSREVRQPFLDHRIAEQVFALPAEYKLDGGQTKRVMRTALGPLLPESIRCRQDKLGYEAPLATWLRSDLSDWASDRLEESATQLQPALRRDYRDAWQTRRATVTGGDATALFSLLTLGNCLDQMKAVASAPAHTS